MDVEDGPLVGVDESLQRLAFGYRHFGRGSGHTLALVECAQDIAQKPVSKEFYRRVKGIEHHCARDEHAHIVEPISVESRVYASEKALNKFARITTVPGSQ